MESGSSVIIALGILAALGLAANITTLVLLFDMRSRNGLLYRAVLYLIKHLAGAVDWNAKHSSRRNMRKIIKKFLKENQD